MPPRWTLDMGAAGGGGGGSAAVRGTLLDPPNVAQEAVPAALMASVHAVATVGASGGIVRPQPAVAQLKGLIQSAPDFRPPRK